MSTVQNKHKNLLLLLLSVVIFFLSLIISNWQTLVSFVIAYQIFTLLRFINNLGNTICILDFLTFYSAFDTLTTPLISYYYFNATDSLAVLWGRVMGVPAEIYFSYLIPANLALFSGAHLIFYRNRRSAITYVTAAKKALQGKSYIGIIFIIVGLLSNFSASFVPDSIAFVFYLLSMLSYIGFFYFYFSTERYRLISLVLLVFVFFLTSVQRGLFGEFLMFMAIASCLISAQYKFKLLNKLLFFFSCFWVVLIIQSVKGEYRKITWNKIHVGPANITEKSNLEIFIHLIGKKLENPKQMFSDESMFFLSYRFNQGWLIARVIRYIPAVEPYARGETIFTSLAAVAVPRFLWPNKPESGGAANLSRFVGIKSRLSYSMNIGPYGEAYGNFGPVGGVFFIFFYGVTLAFFLHTVLKLARRYPTLVIWIPLLFYYTLTVETDLLSTLNSFVKISIFVSIIYWIFGKFYKINI
ncbi:MAG: hypothetical protein ACTHLE_10965 [Agriterribacter sp.]